MNGAELDTRRRALGLSIEETAQLLDEVTVRTVNRWIRDEQPIGVDAAARMDALEDRMEAMVERAVAAATDVIGGGTLPLIRYRTADAYHASADKAGVPFGAHAIVCAWTADALAGEGIDVQFVWSDAGSAADAAGIGRVRDRL